MSMDIYHPFIYSSISICKSPFSGVEWTRTETLTIFLLVSLLVLVVESLSKSLHALYVADEAWYWLTYIIMSCAAGDSKTSSLTN